MGDGSNKSDFIINFTSPKLLEVILVSSTLGIISIYHIDATYKITKLNYPLVVIGRSDYNGVFFPIVISIVSHEQGVDFKHILDSFVKLLAELKISFNPTCFMQDACAACKNALKQVLKREKKMQAKKQTKKQAKKQTLTCIRAGFTL